MRSCIYCGRELGDGEKCNCAKAAARRAAKDGGGESAQTAQTTQTTQSEQTGQNAQSGQNEQGGYYRTGYTGNDGWFRRTRDRVRTKRAVRQNRARSAGVSGSARDIFSYIWRFIKSPATEIANPRDFAMWQMLIIAAVQGAIIGLCVYFIMTGASRGWFRALANIIGFGGINGYLMIMYAVAAAISGAAGGVCLFFAHAGIFWLINRFIFRLHTGFTAFSQRLVMTNIPFTVFAAVGMMLSFISTTTLMILLMCGALSSFILTYIALNEEWSAFTESRVLYSMLLGYFIMFTFVFSLLRISIIGG